MKRNAKIISLHRYIGIVICVFLVLLSVTGIFLNHTDDLNLDKRFINWPWLLKHYGLAVPQPKQNFNLGQNAVTNYDGQIFYNEKLLFQNEDEIKGAVEKKDFLYIALTNEIMVFDATIEIIDVLENTPAPIQLIGTNSNDDQIRILDGNNQSWVYDEFNNAWAPDISKVHDWSQLEVMSTTQMARMNKYFLSKGISLEQFLLDLHNGAVLKKVGKYLLDIIGILTFVLSITGILLWSNRKR